MNSQPDTRPALMISMLVLAIFFSMGSRVIFSPLMPSLQKEMGFSLSAAGSLFLLVSLAYGTAMLFSGFLSSRIGHGKTIVTALSSIALGLVTAALASGIPVLAAGMLLIGAGAGIYPPSGMAMINTKIHHHQRNTAFSLHEIGPNLALLLVPLIVLFLQPHFGWRGVLFWMAGICGMAALAFLRWGAPESGTGAAPDIRILGRILRSRKTLLGMTVMSASVAGTQGVYQIIPAFLVSEYSFDSGLVNVLLSVSRITGILLLLRTGAVISRFGRRRTITGILLFSAFFTTLVGLTQGPLLALAVVVQPALLAALYPPLLSSIAEIGELRYQNLTYGVIITAGVAIGGGAAPALLGFFADIGLGWAGFSGISLFMISAVLFLMTTPEFGKEPDKGQTS